MSIFFFLQGRPTEAMTELKPLNYGEIEAKDFIPGAEALAVAEGEESSEVCIIFTLQLVCTFL